MSVLCLRMYDEMYMVSPSDILYIMSDDHYCQVTYVSGLSFMLPYGLGQMDDLLQKTQTGEPFLMRLGRRYIVNVRRILYVSTAKQVIIMSDDAGTKHSLRISKPVLREFIDRQKNNLT